VDQAAIFSISRTVTGALSFTGEASVAGESEFTPKFGPSGAGLWNSRRSGGMRQSRRLLAAKSLETTVGIARQVLLYCSRLDKCGTFMHCHVPKVNPE